MGLPLPRRMRPETKPGHANNRTVAHLRANRQSFAPGVLVSRTTVGTFQRAKRVFEKAVGGGKVQQFRLKSVQGDYLTCHSWDGTTEGSTDVYIAKPYKLRRSVLEGHSQTYDVENWPAATTQVTASYTYSSNTFRTVTIAGATENQIVVPRFIVNDLIYAIEVDGGSGVLDPTGAEITLIDENLDGRAWSRSS